MSGKYTHIDLRDKVDYEGGVTDAITGYGISPESLPDNTPDNVRQAWQRVYDTRNDISLISEWLDTALDEDEDEEHV